MTRRSFGGGAGDFVAKVSNGTLTVVATTVTMWTARTGGTQITDLLNGNGTAVTSILTDSNGQIGPFSGPNDDTDSMWADAGGPNRTLLMATDTGSYESINQLVINALVGQTADPLTVYDHTGAPIAGIPLAGGLYVSGDNFRVLPPGDLLNPIIKLRSDGTIQAAKGDPAGGAGVEAWGAVTTVPTANPDGTHTLDGSTTRAGGVGWVDANGRRFWRRLNGISRQLDGAHVTGSPNVATVGDWLLPPTHSLGTFALGSGNNGWMFLLPVDVSDTKAVYNLVGAYCSVAGVGGTYQQFRFGIFADDGTGNRPQLSSQIADFGVASGGYASLLSAAPTATLSPTFSFSANGRYWLAVAYQESGTITTYPTLYTANSPVVNAGTDLSGYSRGWYVTGVTGALPTTGTLTATQVVPFVGLRRSA